MFRSKVRERRIFSNRRQKRRRFAWLGTIASVMLFLLILELLTRILIDISGDRQQPAQTKSEPSLVEAYQLNFIEPGTTSKEDRGGLKAKKALSVGYELVGNQTSQHWQINEQGFRDDRVVPLQKSSDEIRIFLLGGSTAFGYGNIADSATISNQLEQRLAQRLQQQQTSPGLYKPDLLPVDPAQRQKSLAKPSKIKSGDYRVINAAVPGYASGNELAQVALKILKYKPDLIVVIDGYPDLMLPSDRQGILANDREEESSELELFGKKMLQPLRNNSLLVKKVEDYWISSQKTDSKANFVLDEETAKLVEHLPESETELQSRIARYLQHHKQILNLGAAAQVPLVVAIQPEITGRNPSQLTNQEGEIATQLGRTYIRRVRDNYPLFAKAVAKLAQAYPQNIKVVDLYKLTDKYPSPSFIDAIHLNEAANEKVAEQLYYAISSFSKMQVTPKAPAPVPAKK